MALKNAYPEKPNVPYEPSVMPMEDVIEYEHTLDVDPEILASAYFMFRNESGNGKKGLNNNFIGAQADGARWPAEFDEMIVGTVKKKENTTNVDRLFLAFRTKQNSVDFLINRVTSRGLYYNGFERLVTKKHVSEQTTLKQAYQKGWITWPKNKKPTVTEEAEALKAVNVALAYLRSWVTGKATYLPDATTVKNIVSMYKQGIALFEYKKQGDPGTIPTDITK